MKSTGEPREIKLHAHRYRVSGEMIEVWRLASRRTGRHQWTQIWPGQEGNRLTAGRVLEALARMESAARSGVLRNHGSKGMK